MTWRENGFIFVNKEENVWKDMDTEEVRTKVRKCLEKSSRYYKKVTAGKRKAGDEDAVEIVDDKLVLTAMYDCSPLD